VEFFLLKEPVRMKRNKKISTTVVATDEAAEQLLWDCLKEVPFLQVSKVEQRLLPTPGRPEIVARVKIGETEKLILAEVKPNGQPRLVREAVADVSKYRQNYADAYGVVVAPFITPEGARVCRAEGVGYIDFAGNCLLNFDKVFVSKTGKTANAIRRKRSRSWYSPRAERVVRTLLLHPNRIWRIRDLANESLVTPNQALHIKEHLGRRQWLSATREGFFLSRPDLLLDEWTENYVPARSTERRFRSSKSVIELETALAGVCAEQIIPYALMGYSAGMRYDPLLKHNRVSAYLVSDLARVVTALDLTEDPDGNVSLWIPYDECVLRGFAEIDGTKVTSPVQTYLDLMHDDGEKFANGIWEQFIRNQWAPPPLPLAEAA
jgi:hypothetical protein